MLQLTSETTPENIRQLEDQILAVAAQRGADQLRKARILLVLDELLTNIRLHAYPDKPGPVRVEILPKVGMDDTLLHIRVHDWGPPFNPLRDSAAPALGKSLDEQPEGGLGLHLVYNMVCGLKYERILEEPPSNGCNLLCLSFPLARSATECAASPVSN